MDTINLRLTGEDNSIDSVLNALRGYAGVDGVAQMGDAERPRMGDDSSSAGLADDAGSDVREVEIRAIDELTLENACDLTEVAARDAGVVIEWLEPF